MIKFIHDLKATVSAQMKVRERLVWYPTILSMHGFLVIHDQTLMTSMQGTVAAAAMLTNGQRVVIVDDLFLTLSDKTQEFILHHEQGHHVYNHKEKRMKRLLQAWVGRVSINEQQADAYGVLMVGRKQALDALGELQQHMPKNKEIRARIQLIIEGE